MLFRIYWENKNIVSRPSKERERKKRNFFGVDCWKYLAKNLNFDTVAKLI